MRTMKSALVVILGVLLAATLVTPARADTVHRTDAKDDARPVIDIHGVDYSHDRRRVRAIADIPDLGRSGSASLSITRFTIFEAGYVIQIRKRSGLAARVRLYYFNHFDLEPRRCAAVSGRWGQDQIKLGVARRCLDGHIRNRLFVQFGIKRGESVDRAPAVRRIERG